jgi:hypothetical protein
MERRKWKGKLAEESIATLKQAGIEFSQHGKWQIVIRKNGCVVDFWPTTARWKDRASGVEGTWASNLLQYLKKKEGV